MSLAIRVEEDGVFLPFGYDPKDDTPRYLAIHDPIDGSSNISKGIKAQTTGVVITKPDGKPEAMAVASLVDSRVVYRDKNGEHMRIGILKRRIEHDPMLTALPLFSRTDIDWVYDVSGLEILNMIDPLPGGPVTHATIDPNKGQPWFELPFPWLAMALGHPVLTRSGSKPSYEAIVRYMYAHPGDSNRTDSNAPRIPHLVAQNKTVAEFLKQELRMLI